MKFARSYKLAGFAALIALVAATFVLAQIILADEQVGPDVDIVSPTDGFTTNSDVTQVAVHFVVSASPRPNPPAT